MTRVCSRCYITALHIFLYFFCKQLQMGWRLIHPFDNTYSLYLKAELKNNVIMKICVTLLLPKAKKKFETEILLLMSKILLND